MKWIIASCALMGLAWGQTEPAAKTTPPPTTDPATMKMQQATAAAAQPSSSQVMIIEPNQRANDYKEAFEYLKKDKSASKMLFTLKDGSLISGIIDMSVMKGGSLLIFKLNTTQGVKYRVIKVEEIDSLTTQ